MINLCDTVIELGFSAGVNNIIKYAKNSQTEREFKRIIIDLLDQYQKRFDNSDIYEEFDFQGLCKCLESSDAIEYVKIAIGGTKSERKRARATLYQLSFDYAHAKTAQSKNYVRNIVSTVIDVLRTLERRIVPLEIQTIIADSVDDINNQMDSNFRVIYADIAGIHDEIKKLSGDNNEKKQFDNLRSAILSNGGRELEDGGIIFNWNQINLDILGFADENDIEHMKKQLGNRLGGNESRNEIITLFWAEAKMTLQSKKRYDVMPLFQNIVRDTDVASIYLDDIPRVVDRVQLVHFYWEDFDVFHLESERYILRILMWKDTPIEVAMSYFLADIPNAHDRLYYFGTILQIVEATSIKIIGSKNINYCFYLDMENLGEDWKAHLELTKYWVSVMENIAEIEQYFHIQFNLPQKASEDDYTAIEIIYGSLHQNPFILLPGLPEEAFDKEAEQQILVIEEEIPLGRPESLDNLTLFNHDFRPTNEFVIPCELSFNKEKRCYETVDGGIPIRIEFEVLNEDRY